MGFRFLRKLQAGYSPSALENTKIGIFAGIFRARVKQICLFVQTYSRRFRYTERSYTRFACSEIENFPQRFPTIPIKGVIFNCGDLSRRLLRVILQTQRQWLKKLYFLCKLIYEFVIGLIYGILCNQFSLHRL